MQMFNRSFTVQDLIYNSFIDFELILCDWYKGPIISV